MQYCAQAPAAFAWDYAQRARTERALGLPVLSPWVQDDVVERFQGGKLQKHLVCMLYKIACVVPFGWSTVLNTFFRVGEGVPFGAQKVIGSQKESTGISFLSVGSQK